MKISKILSMALAAAAAAALLPANAALADGGYDTWTEAGNAAEVNIDYAVDADGNYTVMTALGLAKIANLVNGAEGDADNMTGKTVTLAADIDLSEAGVEGYPESVDIENSWIPIGNGENVFNGTFDGARNSINELYVYAENEDAGLFGRNAGTVKNVETGSGEIKLTVDSADSSGYSVGMVASNTNTVQNCINRVDITVDVDIINFTDGIYIGGVVGKNVCALSTPAATAVLDCLNYGDINGSCDITNNAAQLYAGGICGTSDRGVIGGKNTLIERCKNYGVIDLTGTQATRAGGIIGYANTSATNVNNCENEGDVSAYGVSYSMVGGIAGYCRSASINYCSNTAEVDGNINVGGILGLSSSAKINNCYNIGSVTGGTSMGGISGKSGTASYCYYLDTCADGGIAGKDTAGRAEARSSEQFASGEVAYLLNGRSSGGVWKQTIGEDAYPNFTGKTVYYDQESDRYYNEQDQPEAAGYRNTVLRKITADETTDDSVATVVLSEIAPNGNDIKKIEWSYKGVSEKYEGSLSTQGTVSFGIIVTDLLDAAQNKFM